MWTMLCYTVYYMSLSIAIVGLPNVGKSTLFNALTDSQILAANYPFATIEPNTAIAAIPDSRLGELAKLYNSKKIIPASVTFVDIAGLVAGASKGEGLGNQFLAHIRTCNAIAQVVRAFEDGDVLRSDSSKDPVHDIDVIQTELALADLQTAHKRRPKLEKELKFNKKIQGAIELLYKVIALLDKGEPVFKHPEITEDESWTLLADMQLITAKPIVYIFNVDEATLQNQAKQNELSLLVAPAEAIFVNAKLEDELRGLDDADKTELLMTYGQDEPGLNRIIRAAYSTLGLQSYLTAGEQEVRAWTIPKAATAPQAAGVIHGDFERGFIAAQIVNYDDLMSAGTMAHAKSAGKVRTEGKQYVMQDGDVVEFRFNV
jgi:ribosome-binding ATPase